MLWFALINQADAVMKKINSLMGGRATTAKDYFDRILTIEETALLLRVSISNLKMAVQDGTPIRGTMLPKPAGYSEAGKMYFDGKDIKKMLDQMKLSGPQI